MIDEPDVFLHQGLQKKLKEYLNTLSSNSQIFVTTHSKIFIDTYKLKNVFLLELDVSKMDSARKKQTITVLKTINIPIEEDTGTQKIKKYLGIEDDKEESLQPYNIIVEGYSDKKYITQLMKYFGVDVPNIICVNGADNVVMYINYYESLYKQMRKRPKTLILLDNDTKGREIFRKIEKNKDKYTNININVSFVPNFLGEMQDGTKLEKVQTNNEIEDFIYPSIICYLINNILKKKCMNCINERNIVNKISKDSFKYKGILDLCEYEKNDKNLERGNEIVFTISNQATESFKTSMANMFNVESNPKIIRILEEQDKKYPEVKNFIKKISKSF